MHIDYLRNWEMQNQEIYKRIWTWWNLQISKQPLEIKKILKPLIRGKPLKLVHKYMVQKQQIKNITTKTVKIHNNQKL